MKIFFLDNMAINGVLKMIRKHKKKEMNERKT